MRLRLIRSFDIPAYNNKNEVASFEFIFQDKEGDRVHASARCHAMNFFKAKPIEGHHYALKNFVVLGNRSKFKTTAHPYKISFLRKTKIEEIFDEKFPHIYNLIGYKRTRKVLNFFFLREEKCWNSYSKSGFVQLYKLLLTTLGAHVLQANIMLGASAGREAPRSYYQNQRMPLERQGGGAQSHEEDMDIGYEDNNRVTQTFEGLEQRFLDDIMKLSREQTDAEDAENARHREWKLNLYLRINAINKQHEEQLFALRARHATRRDEFLRRESQARQQQYQQMVMEPYPTNNNIGPSDLRGYNPVDASAGEPHHGYNSESYDAYRERSRFPGNVRDHGHDSKVPYPKGRAYEPGSRFY
ncbi:hypothetical protein OROGR_022199 [Orobanche gracilis]